MPPRTAGQMPDDEHTRRARPPARRTTPQARRLLIAFGATLVVGLVVGLLIGLAAFSGGGTTTTTVARTVAGTGGETTPGAATAAVARSDVRLAVLNRAGARGRAGTADRLHAGQHGRRPARVGAVDGLLPSGRRGPGRSGGHGPRHLPD